MAELTIEQRRALAIADANIALKNKADSPLRGYRRDEPVRFGLGGFLDAIRTTGGLAGDVGIGALDLAKTAIPGMASRIGAGVLAAPVMLSDPEASQQILEKYTKMPPLMTSQGERFAESIAPVAEDLETGVADVFGRVPGGPAAQALARTAVQGPLEILGYRGLGSGVKGASNAVDAATSSMKFRGAPAMQRPGTFIPGVKDLFNAGRVAFTEARISGGGLKPEFLQRTANRIRNLKDKETGLTVRFSERTNPVAAGLRQDILDDLDSGNIGFDELMELRQQAGNVAGMTEASDRRLGLILKNQIDEIIESITPDDVLSGDPQRAAQSLDAANRFWRDASKARELETQWNLAGIDAEDFTGAGFENKLRIRFRQLARRIETGKERGWTQQEIDAIQKVANGSSVGNAFRWMGKSAATGMVSGGIGAGVGYLMGGPLLAAGIPVTGALGRHFATRATIGNAKNAMELPLRRSVGLLDSQ